MKHSVQIMITGNHITVTETSTCVQRNNLRTNCAKQNTWSNYTM